MGSNTRKATGEVPSNGSGKVDRENLGGPLRGKTSMDRGVKRVVGMKGLSNGIVTGEEVGRN
jgi:hypothetical protein